MREYFTPQRSVFPSYLTVESGRREAIHIRREETSFYAYM